MSAAAIDLDAVRTLGEVARYHAGQRPGAIALAFEGRETTYRELDRRSNQVARALMVQGVGKGDRIAYLGKNSDQARTFRAIQSVRECRPASGLK